MCQGYQKRSEAFTKLDLAQLGCRTPASDLSDFSFFFFLVDLGGLETKDQNEPSVKWILLRFMFFSKGFIEGLLYAQVPVQFSD